MLMVLCIEIALKQRRRTFYVCCLTVQMRRKYPKGSFARIHSLFDSLLSSLFFALCVVNFPFSTHCSFRSTFYISFEGLGIYFSLWECILDDFCLHSKHTTDASNWKCTFRYHRIDRRMCRQLIRLCNKYNGKKCNSDIHSIVCANGMTNLLRERESVSETKWGVY